MNFQPLFEAIRKRLADNIPDVHIDLYNGQYEEKEPKTDGYPLDAIFIEFETTSPQTLGRKRQQADVDIMIYVESHCIQSVAQIEKQSERDKAFAHMQLCEKINFWLSGFTDNERVGSLTHTEFSPGFTPRTDHIMHSMRYRCRYVDDSAMRMLKKVTPAQEVNTNIIPD